MDKKYLLLMFFVLILISLNYVDASIYTTRFSADVYSNSQRGSGATNEAFTTIRGGAGESNGGCQSFDKLWHNLADNNADGGYDFMSRSWMTFTTGNTIPESATITSSLVSFTVRAKINQNSWAGADPNLAFTRFAPNSNTSCQSADYNIARWSSTRLANDLNPTASGNMINVSLNSAGNNEVGFGNRGIYTTIGFRSVADVDGTNPSSGGGTEETNIQSVQNSSNPLLLFVTYTVTGAEFLVSPAINSTKGLNTTFQDLNVYFTPNGNSYTNLNYSIQLFKNNVSQFIIYNVSTTNNTFTSYAINKGNLSYDATYIAQVRLFDGTYNSFHTNTSEFLITNHLTRLNNYTKPSIPRMGEIFNVTLELNGTDNTNELIIFTNFTIRSPNNTLMLVNSNGTYTRNGNIFNYTSSNVLIQNSSNHLGTWEINYTARGNNSNFMISGTFNFSITDSFTPRLSITQPTGAKTSRTVTAEHSITEDSSFSYCFYNVTRGGNIEISNREITNCSTNTSLIFTVTLDATFNYNVWANDTTGNSAQASSSFTVDASSPSSPGGGGGGFSQQAFDGQNIAFLCNQSWELNTITGTTAYQFFIAEKSSRSKPIVLNSLENENNLTLSLSCKSSIPGICDSVEFEDEITLKPKKGITERIKFNLPEKYNYNSPDNKINFDIYVNDNKLVKPCTAVIEFTAVVSRLGIFSKLTDTREILGLNIIILIPALFIVVFTSLLTYLIFKEFMKSFTAVPLLLTILIEVIILIVFLLII